jgi:penicillin amidase
VSTARRLFQLALGRRLPRTTGVETVAGIDRPVTIHRDAWHIPHIFAGTDADAYYGMGFAQGQDRAFQIEITKRTAAGTLSELIGGEGLAVDRLARRLGLRHRAERQLADLRPDLRGRVEAFARGVTAGAGPLGSPDVAHEFTLLRAQPTPHTAADVVTTLKLQAFLLAGNWQDELVRLRVLTADGEAALRALDARLPAHLPAVQPVARAVGQLVDRLGEDLELLRGHVPLGGASNNWAVAGTRTATGRPLVANDPHLNPGLPAPWYLLHARTPDWAIAGAALVGTPGVAAGHNGHGAWGVTAGLTDDTDLFIEELGPDAATVRGPDGPVACEVRRETILVKDAEPVIEEVVEGPRGPLVGDTFGGPAGADRVALSVRGVWLDGGPVQGLLDVATATSFDDFRARFVAWPGLALNLVWADSSGTIGWQLVGELPVRRTGTGAVPLPGWLPEAGWTDGRIPFAAMPSLRDPDLGFVATANNAPLAGGAAFLGGDFLDGYRAAAILERLDARDDWDVDTTLALQLDTSSLPWLELRRTITALAGSDEDSRLALDLLRRWDGRVSADSPAAAVYELAMAELARRVVRARAPRAGHWLLGEAPVALLPHGLAGVKRTAHLVELVREQPDGWFEAGWPAVLLDVLAVAVRELRRTRGTSVGSWRWGDVRPLTLRHAVGRAVPRLSEVFDRGPFPLPGDATTIPQASPPSNDPTGDPVAIANLRMVVDVGAWERSRWVLAGGQSGNPVSPHYDDQLDRWRDGRAIPIPWSPDAVAAATVATLRLLPTAPVRHTGDEHVRS